MTLRYFALALLCAVMALSGCATRPTTAAFDEQAQQWIGKNADELVMQKGPPTSTFTLSNGGRVFQYERSVNVVSGGGTYAMPTTTYISSGPNAGTWVQGQAVHSLPVGSKTLNCTVRFTVDTSNTIIAWSKEGNRCVARPTPK